MSQSIQSPAVPRPAPSRRGSPFRWAPEAARSAREGEGQAVPPELRRGRGAGSNPTGRFESLSRFVELDGWSAIETLPAFRTEVSEERARTIITENDSPDLSFERSANPYRGCEHGCVYCFARPTHSHLGLSPGLDFETKLVAKPEAARLLEQEIGAPGYRVKPLALGTNTDPYQPIERSRRITRAMLEVLEAAGHPVGIVTKSALVARDADILGRMAARGLAKVAISITTLDPALARSLEPRASTPARRLEAVRALSEAGVPVSVLVAPVIPAVNDAEIERILDAAHAAGAREAGYVLLRLPRETAGLMREWLAEHRPASLHRVMGLLQGARGGKDYDSRFGLRMTGTGPYAWMIGRRFEIAANRLGLNAERARLRTDLFERPGVGRQLALL